MARSLYAAPSFLFLCLIWTVWAHFVLCVADAARSAVGGKAAVDLITSEQWLAMFKYIDEHPHVHDRWSKAKPLVPGASRWTMRRRYASKDSSPTQHGPDPTLGKDGESILVEWLLGQWTVGNCVRVSTLIQKARALALALKRKAVDVGGRDWVGRFFERHTQISQRTGGVTGVERLQACTVHNGKRFLELASVALDGVRPDDTWVMDECGVSGQRRDRKVRIASLARASIPARARTHTRFF